MIGEVIRVVLPATLGVDEHVAAQDVVIGLARGRERLEPVGCDRPVLAVVADDVVLLPARPAEDDRKEETLAPAGGPVLAVERDQPRLRGFDGREHGAALADELVQLEREGGLAIGRLHATADHQHLAETPLALA